MPVAKTILDCALAAHGILLLATALVIVQMVPLPTAAIEWLAPRTTKLLPLWTPGASNVSLGTWQTITLTPHETALSLSMLLSYGLLFIVVAQRVQAAEDVVRLLKWVAISAVAMAGFGLVQYFTTNGKFFWFYQHPFRTTGECVQGSFANRNHFASFLVLGLGPLVAWLLATAAPQSTSRARPKRVSGPALDLRKHGLFVAVGIVLVAILLSLSRGGALALAASALTLSFVYLRWGRIEAKHTTGAIGFMIVLLGVLSVYGYEKVADRLGDLTEGSLQALDRKEGRRKIWAANLAAFEDGWLTGAGAGSHREIYPVYLRDSPATEYTHAENGYLQIATEMGIGGLALLTAVFGLCSAWCYTCLCAAEIRSRAAVVWRRGSRACCQRRPFGGRFRLVHSRVHERDGDPCGVCAAVGAILAARSPRSRLASAINTSALLRIGRRRKSDRHLVHLHALRPGRCVDPLGSLLEKLGRQIAGSQETSRGAA